MSGISIIVGSAEIGAIGMIITIAPSKRKDKPLIKISPIILLLSFLANPVYIGYYFGVSKIHRAFNTLYTPIFESFFTESEFNLQ